VVPEQPWLDGIACGEGDIKQFVATRMGKGYTVEAQVTGQEFHGGLQFEVTPSTVDVNKKIKTFIQTLQAKLSKLTSLSALPWPT
jgi:hypothetical protein